MTQEALNMYDTFNQLNTFQHEIIRDIIYFTEKKGEYFYFKKYVYNLYSELYTPEYIDTSITELVEKGLVFKTCKKVRFDGRLISKIILTFNEDYFFNHILYENQLQEQLNNNQNENIY